MLSRALFRNSWRGWTRAAKRCPRRLKPTSQRVSDLLAAHVERFAVGRANLTQALQDDLDKLAESRSSIDGLVAGQVEKLAEGRDILKRALEADLNTIKEVLSGQRLGLPKPGRASTTW